MNLKPAWRAGIVGRILRIHSPSAHVIYEITGKKECWCHRG